MWYFTGFLCCLCHSDTPYTDEQIMPALLGVFQHSYQKKEAKIAKSFCSGIINLLFDGFTSNTCTCGHFAHCLYKTTTKTKNKQRSNVRETGPAGIDRCIRLMIIIMTKRKCSLKSTTTVHAPFQTFLNSHLNPQSMLCEFCDT